MTRRYPTKEELLRHLERAEEHIDDALSELHDFFTAVGMRPELNYAAAHLQRGRSEVRLSTSGVEHGGYELAGDPCPYWKAGTTDVLCALPLPCPVHASPKTEATP